MELLRTTRAELSQMHLDYLDSNVILNHPVRYLYYSFGSFTTFLLTIPSQASSHIVIVPWKWKLIFNQKWFNEIAELAYEIYIKFYRAVTTRRCFTSLVDQGYLLNVILLMELFVFLQREFRGL